MTSPRRDGGGARREPAAGSSRATTSGVGGMAAIAGEGGQDAEREREGERARLATAHAALRVFVQWKLQETAHLMRKTIGYAVSRRGRRNGASAWNSGL